MKKRKAFTLVELLAVIIILAIIALIAIPIIINIIGVVRKESFKTSLNGLFDAYDLYLFQLDEEVDDPRISVVDDRLQLKSNFISGEITTDADGNYVVDLVTDGDFCAKGVEGNIKIVSGGCGKLDETPPEVTISISSVSSNHIKIAVEAFDPEGAIIGYAYSLDGEEYTDLLEVNTYEFHNLKSNQTYHIFVQVTNEYNLVATEDIEVKTVEIGMPTYVVNTSGWAKTKTVTITYPELEGQSLHYEYSLDDGSKWEEATPNQVLTFNQNGSVIARISDGINTITGSTYFVTKIDNEGPSISVSANTTAVTSNPITLTVTGVDSGEGSVKYRFNNGSYGTTNTYTVNTPGDVVIYAQDGLGNTSTKTVTITGKTEYGYQDVASWSSSYSTTAPSDGYYKSKTQYQVNYSWTETYTYTSECQDIQTIDCASSCPGGYSVWHTWPAPYCTNGQTIGVQCGRTYSCQKTGTRTRNGTTGWQDSSTSVPKGNKTGIAATRTVYAAPSSWGAATGWRTDTPYTQTSSRKPVTRTSLQYVG